VPACAKGDIGRHVHDDVAELVDATVVRLILVARTAWV
jgi:hypothetical protein